MDGEPPMQWRVFSSEIDNPFVGGFAQPHLQTIVMGTTISLHGQVTLRTFDALIRLHISKLG